MKYENFNETTLLALLVMMTFWEVEGCSTFLNCLTEKKKFSSKPYLLCTYFVLGVILNYNAQRKFIWKIEIHKKVLSGVPTSFLLRSLYKNLLKSEIGILIIFVQKSAMLR